MFCFKCAEKVNDDHSQCPNCGNVLSNGGEVKPKYYCKRCKRKLPSKICPIHGMDSTINIELLTGDSSQPHPETFSSNGNGSLGEQTPKPVNVSGRALQDTVYSGTKSNPEQPATDVLYSTAISRQTPAGNTESILPSTAENPNIGDLLAKAAFNPEVKREPNRAAQKPAVEPKKKAEKQKSNPRPVSTPKNSTPSKLRPWMFRGLAVLALVISAAAFYSYYYPNYLSKSLYSEAEGFFNQGHYEAALQLYLTYKEKYPAGGAVSMVNERIAQIQRIDAESTQKQVKIYTLMKQAADAFNDQRYLEPPEDNAAKYVSEILQVEPGFTPALQLQNRILDHFFEQAEAAFDGDRYDEAVGFYHNILAIKPDDPVVATELDRAMKLKYVYGMLDDVNGVEEAKTELKKLQKEKYKLKNQIQQERRKLKDISQKIDSLNDNAGEKLTESKGAPSRQAPIEVLPIAAGISSPVSDKPAISGEVEEFFGITLSADDSSKPSPGKEKIRVVDETLIDGGRKEYLQREKPPLPVNYLQPGEMTMILGECIVGIDGNIEEVSLISPAGDEKLNQLAMETLKKYRFKPATFNGEPVRFKSIEVISF